jgi:hypothetical protein
VQRGQEAACGRVPVETEIGRGRLVEKIAPVPQVRQRVTDYEMERMPVQDTGQQRRCLGVQLVIAVDWGWIPSCDLVGNRVAVRGHEPSFIYNR